MTERYPAYRAGQKVTGDLLTSAQSMVVRKASDTSRASTITNTPDPELQFSVEANAVYVWHGWIKYDAATGSGDIKLDWGIPTGSLGEWVGTGIGTTVIGSTSAAALQIDTVNSQGYMIRAESNDVSQERTYGGLGTGTQVAVLIHGTLRVGGTAGTFSLDWSQGTSNATASTIYTDSYIWMQRIA